MPPRRSRRTHTKQRRGQIGHFAKGFGNVRRGSSYEGRPAPLAEQRLVHRLGNNNLHNHMLTIMRQRVRAYMSQRVYSLLGIFFLLLSLTLTTHAMLTVSNSGLSGDANVAVDGSGTLNIGTASSTGITIGRSGQAVNFPGNLSITGNATTTGNLTVLGELFDAGGNSYATSTSGSNPWTTVSGGISYSSGNVTVGTTVLGQHGIATDGMFGRTALPNWNATVGALSVGGLSTPVNIAVIGDSW